MFAGSSTRRKLIRWAAAAAASVLVSGCVPTGPSSRGPSLDPGAPVPVALLLPSAVAGDDVIARSLRQAAELAAADLGGVSIDLRVYQTGATSGEASATATRAIAEGAKIILGPLRSDETMAVGAAAAGAGVNVLSFSNNTEVAGGNVFVLGQTFRNTADRLVNFAGRQGIRSIAVVHDQTGAGDIISGAVQQAIRDNGAAVATVGSYEFSQQGIISAARSIAAQVTAAGAQAVIFTADPAGALPLITQLMSETSASPDRVRYIGVTRWDQPTATLSLPPLQGGWFAIPSPELTRQFEARYTAAYGEPPHVLAGLAYDGIAAIGALARSGNANALSAAGITQGAGFAGVNGVFRFRADGSNERGLAVATIRDAQVVVIDPAPRSFGGLGL